MQTKLLPIFYETHLKSQLSRAEYLILYMLVSIMQIHRIVKLEELASIFPHKILFQSRRKKLQRFLSIPQLTLEIMWFPLIKFWISQEFEDEEVLLIAIDRTQWRGINLLTISLIYDRRAIPIYFHLLPKVGCCNFEQQKQALTVVLNLLSYSKKIVLGDREFCSVDLAGWLRTQPLTDFCIRLKRSHYIEVEPGIWQQLNNIGLAPGISLFLQGIKITKTKGFIGANIACKWKRKYGGWTAEEGWFILTSLPNLNTALSAYSKRFGIEEMFRDFKSGGYNLEDCYLEGHRLIALLIIVSIAYSSATMAGQRIKTKGVTKYVARVKEPKRTKRRHSSFYIGLHGESWLESLKIFANETKQLMALSPHKLPYYQRGQKAEKLIYQCF